MRCPLIRAADPGDPSRIGRRGIGAQRVTQSLNVATAHGDDDPLHRRVEMQIALVFAPVGITLLVGDQLERIGVGE
jgi:hypothetical protein